MKLTVAQVRNLWFGFHAIYEANDTMPTKFEFHVGDRMLPVIRKEQEKIEKLDQQKFEEIANDEIELPISKIDPSILPDKMPQVQSTLGKVSALLLIKPILIQSEQPEHESQVARLLKGQENGTETKEEN